MFRNRRQHKRISCLDVSVSLKVQGCRTFLYNLSWSFTSNETSINMASHSSTKSIRFSSSASKDSSTVSQLPRSPMPQSLRLRGEKTKTKTLVSTSSIGLGIMNATSTDFVFSKTLGSPDLSRRGLPYHIPPDGTPLMGEFACMEQCTSLWAILCSPLPPKALVGLGFSGLPAPTSSSIIRIHRTLHSGWMEV